METSTSNGHGSQAPSGADYSRHSSDDLARCVDQLHGIHNATMAEIFAIVCELARRGDFARDGAKDAAGWLQLRLRLPYRTAKRWADVALALKDLPHLREAFSSGRLSFDQVAAAVELATPENDAQVAKEARHLTVKALERIVRRARNVTPREEAEARRTRRAWWTWRAGGTMLEFGGRMPAEQGAKLAAALERTAAQLPARDAEGPVTMAQRRADALAALASVQITSDADPDRATVMVHVDLETLRTGVGSSWTEEGALLSAETVSKLLCDARLKAEWTKDHGPTDPDNLPLMCPVHHPLVHGPEWHIGGNPTDGLVFVGPKGLVRDGPPPLDYDVKKWLWEELYRPSSEMIFDSS